MVRPAFALFAALPMLAQAPAFEVASVKPTAHGRDANGLSRSFVDVPHPGRLVAENSSLSELIRFAYDLDDYRLQGPAWLNDDEECFDVAAKAPAGTTKKQLRLMLRTLMAERFGLAAHTETRMLPVYNLTVDKKGARLTPAKAGGRNGYGSSGGNVTASRVTMADFAYQLSRDLKLPVFDKTGIAGAFDFTLHYETDPNSDRGPSLSTAVQETLGLKLESAKGPVEVLVVDHINRSLTEN
jgi:uncharacterized protein (TIGR03435 family)